MCVCVCACTHRYVDVALELLEKAGDYVSEEVWHRVVQLVTNNPAMQQYAALNVAQVLKRGSRHEVSTCLHITHTQTHTHTHKSRSTQPVDQPTEPRVRLPEYAFVLPTLWSRSHAWHEPVSVLASLCVRYCMCVSVCVYVCVCVSRFWCGSIGVRVHCCIHPGRVRSAHRG